MTSVRSFAKLHRVECLHCGQYFDQWGKRGRLRRTCSDECRDARYHHQRTVVRQARYRAARDAGASYQIAQWASNGVRIFNATLDVLAAGAPPTEAAVKRIAKPRADRSAMPPLTPSTPLDVTRKPAARHPWRGRRSGTRAA